MSFSQGSTNSSNSPMSEGTAIGSKIFSVEGNIGSGKSTLLRLIDEKIAESQVVREPVNNWQAIDGNPELNLLDSFYQNPSRWGYTFQIYAYYSRLKQWQEIVREKPYVVCERSVISDKHIFALNGHKGGFFNELEWAMYNDYFNFFVEKFHADRMDGIIYLSADPQICLNRLQKRGRDEEKDSIQLQYLQDIHNRHEEWLSSTTFTENSKIPVLIINGNIDFEHDGPRQREILSQVTRFMQSLQPMRM